MAREGVTTGSCAAAAAKAAALFLTGGEERNSVLLSLPGGRQRSITIDSVHKVDGGAEAVVVKDAGDDADVTHGASIRIRLNPLSRGETTFSAGEGVGKITKAGLSLPIGEAAINPVPRQMIRRALREVAQSAFHVSIGVDGGEALAQQTWNPRLGIVGGVSIIGTTGIVRPFCRKALQDSLRLELQVTAANGNHSVVLVPGHYGARAAQEWRSIPEEGVIEVVNEWECVLEKATRLPFSAVEIIGHPGKIVKLANGDFYTRSSHSASPIPRIIERAQAMGLLIDSSAVTTEGLFASLPPKGAWELGSTLAEEVTTAVVRKTRGAFAVRTGFVLMSGDRVGESRWRYP